MLESIREKFRRVQEIRRGGANWPEPDVASDKVIEIWNGDGNRSSAIRGFNSRITWRDAQNDRELVRLARLFVLTRDQGPDAALQYRLQYLVDDPSTW
jgi:hypothetical protein